VAASQTTRQSLRSSIAHSASNVAALSLAGSPSIARLRVVLQAASALTAGGIAGRISGSVCGRDGLEATALHVAAAAPGPEAARAVELLAELSAGVDTPDGLPSAAAATAPSSS